jgi:hypothetical protein
MDEKGRDVSAVIRGRLYQLKDIISLNNELESHDKMRRELAQLEEEGYTATPDEGLPIN